MSLSCFWVSSVATLGDAYKLVKDVTGYDWKVENVTGIVKTLEEKIDASNA
jgi:hypothetical protein